MGYPWPSGTIAVFFPKFPSYVLHPGGPQSSPPSYLTSHLLPSCREAWKHLDAVRRSLCSAGWFFRKAVLWSFRIQVASDIHTFLAWIMCGGFLASFWSSAKPASYSSIGPLFGGAIGQMALPLWYLIFRLSLLPLSSYRIIRWYVDTLGSLMLTL